MGKFGAIRSVRQEHPEPQNEIEGTVHEALPQPTPISMKGRPTGKRSNPEFEPTTIFLRKTTKKIANRTLEDSDTKQDLSELIEELLRHWISAHA